MAGKGRVLIRTSRSLISAGTERMLVEFAKSGLMQKALRQPDRLKQVLDKVRTDGLTATLEAVFRKLDEPIALGYCNVGTVLDLGAGCDGLSINDRVVSNGPHSEFVSVPRNLCARVPDGVSDEEAAFTVLGAIALQGIRLANPTLGERFIVQGLGLIGLLTVQMLRANGCEVLGVDLNETRLALAEKFGALTFNARSGGDLASITEAWSQGVGADGVIITASATTDEIIHQSAGACRKRGRIVMVGVVGLNLRRDDFYKKELSFQVSCSYGPGRYDDNYEQGGQDYPLPYVRWTEQRNFEAVLGTIKSGALDVRPLVTHRFKIEDATLAYEVVRHDSQALGVVLQYPAETKREPRLSIYPAPDAPPAGRTPGTSVVGIIGAGNFARAVMLPILAKKAIALACIAARNPVAAASAARKFHVSEATTDAGSILRDNRINTVFALTGHDSHAHWVCEALKAGKHVFVEKPLCLSAEELSTIESVWTGLSDQASPRLLMVGFNRRFSAHTLRIKELLKGRSEPLCMSMTINSGPIPADHWTQDPKRGGGRIIGEACHFIDLLSFLAGTPVTLVSAMMIGRGPAVQTDKMTLQMSFADGSIGMVNYFANGSRSYPKETLEVFSQGRIARLDNFRLTTGFGFKGFRKYRTWRQDKGHDREVSAFLEQVSLGGPSPIPFAALRNVSLATFAAMESARTGHTVQVPDSLE
jgi:predicted dehydrogenase/threonine dehydrogenase-like Zn-dependent dehydrogenase